MLIPLLGLALVAATSAADRPYTARGTEPFWSLTIGRAAITFRPAEGRATTVAKPRPTVEPDGERYRSRALTVEIARRRCSDGMSERLYADTVTVRVAGRVLHGCGGAIVANEPGQGLIAGTEWRVDMVDDRALPSGQNATIAFTADRIQGRVCNSFGGAYRFTHGKLTAGPLTATRMACAGPIGMAERVLFRLLAGPVSVSQGRPDTLRLSDGRASVTLRRLS